MEEQADKTRDEGGDQARNNNTCEGLGNAALAGWLTYQGREGVGCGHDSGRSRDSYV